MKPKQEQFQTQNTNTMTNESESGDTRQLRTWEVSVADTNRNTRQRTDATNRVEANNGAGIFRTHVDLNMENIEVYQSNTPGAMQRRPFNPNSAIMSLQDYIQNGTQHGKIWF